MTRVEPADLPEKVQEIIQKIVEGYDPEKIIVFGSYARGDWTEDSDLDLLVVK
ncbi:MAG: nucleotidyltransferase domain-containing protein, partial [Armatimonadota bacterium]